MRGKNTDKTMSKFGLTETDITTTMDQAIELHKKFKSHSGKPSVLKAVAQDSAKGCVDNHMIKCHGSCLSKYAATVRVAPSMNAHEVANINGSIASSISYNEI